MKNAYNNEHSPHYLHATVHKGFLTPYVQDVELHFQTLLKPVHTKYQKVTRSYHTLSNKVLLLEIVLFLLYLTLLWISVLSLNHLPSLIVLIRILRIVVVISELFLFVQQRRLRKRVHLLYRKESLMQYE